MVVETVAVVDVCIFFKIFIYPNFIVLSKDYYYSITIVRIERQHTKTSQNTNLISSSSSYGCLRCQSTSTFCVTLLLH